MILSLSAAAAIAAAGCSPSAADQRWIEGARTAWRSQLAATPEITPPPKVTVILFDARCRLSSMDALARSGSVHWRSSLHRGSIVIGDGTRIKPGVTSFAGEGGGGQTFVMALPTVWRAGRIPPGSTGIDALTTAVLLHEASHVAQGRLLGAVTTLSDAQGWGTDFNDDSIQDRFEKQPAFAAAVREETRLLFAAAASKDRGEARRLAEAAVASIRQRRARWFNGKDQALGRAEDLFLTLEGSGQYLGYRWLTDPGGGGFSHQTAMSGWGQRGRWWSQKQGLALVLAVERLGYPGWRRELWGRVDRPGVRLLEAALSR